MWTIIILIVLTLVYYKFMHKNFMLGAFIFNYDVDDVLERALQKSIASGIEKIERDFLEITIMFKDGSRIQAWDGNRYYAWLANGYFWDKGPEYNKRNPAYHWYSGRPTVSTMLKLRDMIFNHN